MGYEQQTESKNGKFSVKKTTDWNSILAGLALFTLIVLCAGKPDLLDRIGQRVGGAKTTEQCNAEVIKAVLENQQETRKELLHEG